MEPWPARAPEWELETGWEGVQTSAKDFEYDPEVAAWAKFFESLSDEDKATLDALAGLDKADRDAGRTE